MRRLTGPYPEAELLIEVAKAAHRRDHHSIARLWLTEGIPFAFRDAPALHEAARAWFARCLGVHPKEVTLIGSARIGFSLARNTLGKPYGEHSDLDFSAISSGLFHEVRRTFEAWAHDYTHRVVVPRNNPERGYWESNLDFGYTNIPKGFMDPNKIPLWKRYPVAQNIAQCCWGMRRKLSRMRGAPIVPRVSVRVYRDWAAFIDQLVVNLRYAVR